MTMTISMTIPTTRTRTMTITITIVTAIIFVFLITAAAEEGYVGGGERGGSSPAPVGLLVEDFLDNAVDLRHAGHAADEQDLVDVVRRHSSILQRRGWEASGTGQGSDAAITQGRSSRAGRGGQLRKASLPSCSPCRAAWCARGGGPRGTQTWSGKWWCSGAWRLRREEEGSGSDQIPQEGDVEG